MFAPVGFGITYFVFPVLFFLFFTMVGVSAIVTRLRARRPQPPVLAVEHACAVVRQKRILDRLHRRYQVVFSFETGDEATFSLTRAQYFALKEGARGILAHKGNQLLCFEQESTEQM